MAGISLRHIRKAYPGGFTAVHDFSLEIPNKEFVILVGPSGCGKSTVLRMIAGLEDISGGELYIGDSLVNEVPPRERNIAMVFQNYALYPHMSIYQNMAFGLSLRNTPEAEIKARVYEAAEVLGIETLLERKPKALSGGQRQRVALGRAMVREPAVFLLDEPLSNLDAKLRTQMRAEISKLHKRLGTTFVYVTHDQTEAMTMGDRIVVMKDGRIRQQGTPQHLYDCPDNVFVAGFIGSPQMNLLPVQLEQRGDVFVALCGESVIPIPQSKASVELLSRHAGKPCLLGVRPENFTVLTNPDPDGHDHLEGVVELAERTGAETYLYLTVYGVNLIARVPPLSVHFGDHVRLTPVPERLHLFDADSGEAIFH